VSVTIHGAPGFLHRRTQRALHHSGLVVPAPAQLTLTAGAWFPWPERVQLPPPSATGQPLRYAHPAGCVYTSAPQAPRTIDWPALAVRHDPRLRVAQVITSLHQGGAERIAASLAAEHRQAGQFCLLITLSSPCRDVLPDVTGIVDLSHLRHDLPTQARALQATVAKYGLDLLHAHLLTRRDLATCAATGVPVVVTVHNTRSGWPTDLAEVTPAEVRLLVGCARAVTAELPATVPTRTVWNGIVPVNVPRLSAPGALRLLVIANPRPQKRLERLPAILAAAQAQWPERTVSLTIVGQVRGSVAQDCVNAVNAAADQLGVTIAWRTDNPPLAVSLAQANALLATSAHEGLSLAQLEALSAGVPVVATAVGGTVEVPGLRTVPVDAAPSAYVAALAELAAATLPTAFTAERMAEHYRALYWRALAPETRAGVWLIANNFSTGGAQSSARRLLLALHTMGVPVRAAVVQEEPTRPTAGTRALQAAGVPVLVLPPADSVSAAEAVSELLAAWADERPQAVLFWNLLVEYKVRLVDAFWDVPVYDVSPGEMFYPPLERFFAQVPRLPYRTAGEYGARLAGAVVKYAAEAEQMRATLGCPVTIIPNGVPLADFPPVVPAPRARLVFGTAARLSPQKKLDELLAGFQLAHARLPAYTLRIAGGPERDGLAYAEHLRTLAVGLPVEWLGDVADMGAFRAGLDIFVLIGDPAGCPNASLEALASGLPVIATDVGGVSEQVCAGVTGRLVPRADAPALAHALVELAHDPALRQRLGMAGRAHIAARFSRERMVADYARLVGLLPGADNERPD
jgi:glycosyltransferase involved in cell wall biosynthesis